MKIKIKQHGFKLFTITVTLALTFYIAFLLFHIVTYARFSRFTHALTSPEILFALKMSVFTASISTFLCVIAALPTAYALSRYKFHGKSIITTLLDIPIALPSLVVGFGLLLFFGATPIGKTLEEIGLVFVFTPLGIILAQFTVNISSMIRVMKATFSSINPRYEHVARTLGCTRFQAAAKVLLPMSRQGLIAATAIAWSKGIGEFGAVIMIAGSTRMKTETLPISLFLEMSTGNLETAAAVASILIVMSVCSLAVFEKYFKTHNHF